MRVAIGLAILAAGCSVDLPADQILCGPAPERSCPDGWFCDESDGHCRPTASAMDSGVPDALPDAPMDSRDALPDGSTCGSPLGTAYDWSLFFDPPGGQANVTAVEVDGSGNVFVTGGTFGSLDLGCGEVSALVGGGERDAFVAKLSPEGALEWLHVFGGTGIDVLQDIANGPQGIFVVGRFSGETAYPMVDGGMRTLSSNGGSDDIVVARLAGDTGRARWIQTFGGEGDDSGFGIALGAQNLCITGRFSGRIVFGDDEIIPTTPSANSFTACLDRTDGEPFWSTFEDSMSAGTSRDIAMSPSDDRRFFVAGSTGTRGWVRRYDMDGAGYLLNSEYQVNPVANGAVWDLAWAGPGNPITILGGFEGGWEAWDAGPELDAFVIQLREDLSGGNWLHQIELTGPQMRSTVDNGAIALAGDEVWYVVPFSGTAALEGTVVTADEPLESLVGAFAVGDGTRVEFQTTGGASTLEAVAYHRGTVFVGGQLSTPIAFPRDIDPGPTNGSALVLPFQP